MIDRDLAYRTLEIESGATQKQIRAAYKTLARVWHPDRLGSDPKLRRHAEEKLKQINAAYELLRQDDGARVPPPPPDSPTGPRDAPDEPIDEAGPLAGMHTGRKVDAKRRSSSATPARPRWQAPVIAVVLVTVCLSVGFGLFSPVRRRARRARIRSRRFRRRTRRPAVDKADCPPSSRRSFEVRSGREPDCSSGSRVEDRMCSECTPGSTRITFRRTVISPSVATLQATGGCDLPSIETSSVRVRPQAGSLRAN